MVRDDPCGAGLPRPSQLFDGRERRLRCGRELRSLAKGARKIRKVRELERDWSKLYEPCTIFAPVCRCVFLGVSKKLGSGRVKLGWLTRYVGVCCDGGGGAQRSWFRGGENDDYLNDIGRRGDKAELEVQEHGGSGSIAAASHQPSLTCYLTASVSAAGVKHIV
ncbi:hypothetical protein JZ751_017751 [Albula glossodonta]|uniref:Uncharacterized protein n=1 Tax=Albula glossodonta TaxID=121402 RepID=A0A8T2PP99_9TELE|nr:hypothetical protein JZ751_017751 [Albula glossodonta]